MVAPLIPLALAGLVLVGCAKVASDKYKARPLASLVGSEWGPAAQATEQFIGFRSGGELVGFGGCNRFFGTYEQSGQSLKIGALASTKMACPDLDREQAFMAKLQDVRRVEATHLSMTLYGEDDLILLQMQRRDWD